MLEQKAELEKHESTIKALQKENEELQKKEQLYQHIIMLIRQGIFENVLLIEEGSGSCSRRTIRARNYAAHGGDVRMDAQMIDVMEKDGDHRLSAYRKVFEDFYGITREQLQAMGQYPAMIIAIDQRASAWLNDGVSEGKEYQIRKMVDRVIERFIKLDAAKEVEEMEDGELSRSIREVDRAYQHRGE